MKIKSILGLAVAAIMVACTAEKTTNENPILTVDGGQIQGVLTDSTNVMVYKGIPYAAPPVGDLRWKRPQAVVPWEGVKVCDKWGYASLQGDHQAGEFYTEEFYFGGDPERSEDCLYLNVWAPAQTLGQTDAKLPVAMWVHGGAYMGGYGHEITMDGDAWATHGVILVTINYRLGVMGFLSHPLLAKEDVDGVSGNYGTWDQVAALKWIHKNIAQFGGDPDNIMIFGQSAGAASIKNLVTSNESKKLVSKAIIQSIGGLGEVIPSPAQDVAENIGKEMMDDAGLTTLEAMRAASPKQLDAAFGAFMAKGKVQGLPLVPHLDGRLLGKSFTEAATDNSIADVPYMLGSTLDDMMPTMGEGIDAFAAVREGQSKHPVFAYRFDRRLPGEPNTAYHSSELWFVFKTLKNSRRPFTPADYDLADRMLDYWTNFAKYGNPNGKDGNGEWKPDTKDNPFVMHLDVK
ncbi:MAG: carboxylesterase family protein [Bacteroidaceae bacterium]|nr:carboxylesterase family protein [Bacteroidaceae bacterium]